MIWWVTGGWGFVVFIVSMDRLLLLSVLAENVGNVSLLFDAIWFFRHVIFDFYVKRHGQSMYMWVCTLFCFFMDSSVVDFWIVLPFLPFSLSLSLSLSP
jgi:hypothetical protein